MEYSKKQQLGKKKEAKQVCRVSTCFIQGDPSKNWLCKHHWAEWTGTNKKKKLEARLDYSLATEKKKNNSPFWNAVKRCDTEFSKYARLFYSDINGFCKCATSGKIMFWKHPKGHTHCGHFQSRKFMNTRWNIKNVSVQSIVQNTFLEGNHAVFAKFIDEYWGEGTANEMIALSRIRKKWTILEINQMTKFYKSECNRLLKEKGL